MIAPSGFIAASMSVIEANQGVPRSAASAFAASVGSQIAAAVAIAGGIEPLQMRTPDQPGADEGDLAGLPSRRVRQGAAEEELCHPRIGQDLRGRALHPGLAEFEHEARQSEISSA